MKKKLFEADTKELRYTIKIDVYNNCSAMAICNNKQEEIKTVGYHEILGVLEAHKQKLIWEQLQDNLSKNMIPKTK